MMQLWVEHVIVSLRAMNSDQTGVSIDDPCVETDASDSSSCCFGRMQAFPFPLVQCRFKVSPLLNSRPQPQVIPFFSIPPHMKMLDAECEFFSCLVRSPCLMKLLPQVVHTKRSWVPFRWRMRIWLFRLCLRVNVAAHISQENEAFSGGSSGKSSSWSSMLIVPW